jgi:hypothetical protein
MSLQFWHFILISPWSFQDKYSVQFDDLFKIAWEDDVNTVSREDDGEQLARDEGTNGNLLPSYVVSSSH